MAKDCAGEGQWKSCLLSGLVEPIQELWPEIVKLSALEKPWISELRLAPPSFEDILGPPPAIPSPYESHSSTTAPPPPSLRDPALLQTPVLSLLSNAPSDCTTDDPNCVSIPRLDIAIGLSHTSFSKL
ncbi:unnamed protein product [Periconia digitata]|uniref:Uncharacterized protein n=1 Tax=Periconia digitata TaxID=1303443 RepID=A0A9W4XJ51_9PLEO|nr:unnamed protein product [Periconia digitata]